MTRRFSVHALASGSSGNTTLVRAGDHAVLIDAGIGLRLIASALATHDLLLSDLSGIVLTHEHSDHIQSAHAISKRYNVPIVANPATLNVIYRRCTDSPNIKLATGDRWSIGDLDIETFPVPHDAVEPVGVNLYYRPSGHKASIITDAGHVTDAMRAAIRGANLLILEANHDVHRLNAGVYPGYLKARILSDRGHLSNEAAVALLCEHAMTHGPHTAWLAHLSKENNTPKLALAYAKATVAVETGCPVVLDVAKRDKPSVSWTPGVKPLQLNLF
ncbi:MBL fold metallo-hydrolase [Capsulimonas corticalis]|uniref:MBL fold metallo-hydrolase n=1 Tax=Capsulimonas corticalis TaxID=2219043 RepID=UPI000E658CD5|nr:MBL fold metallo-hydrolase [Capsulimonas corticalis]